MNAPTTPAEVHDVYERERDRTADLAKVATAQGERIGGFRLLAFAALTAVGIAAWTGSCAVAWILLPLAAFVALVTHGARIDQRRLDAERAHTWYLDGLGRLSPTSSSTRSPTRSPKGNATVAEAAVAPLPGSAPVTLPVSPVDATHPYADDIDLFGPDSLFARLDRTRTRAGAATLVGLLAEPPPSVAAVHERHAAVRELAPLLHFRERLASVAGEAHRGTRADSLAAWTQPPVAPVSRLRWLGWILTSIASTVTVVGWLAGFFNALPMAVALLVHIVVLRPERTWIREVLERVRGADPELGMLRRLIDVVSPQNFQSPALQQARADLDGDPSAILSRAQRKGAYVESLANPFFLPIALLLNLPAHLANSLEQWRETNGNRCVTWSRAIAQIEAFASVAGYDFEVPHHAVPDVAEGPARFEAVGLFHPLLASGVPNDVHLGEDGPDGWIVSGSNMSGKSTLLRSIGSALVLAYAGSRVPATSLRLTRLLLGASIQIRDALSEGVSRFQAELIRLRRIYDLSGEGPCLYLLDEVLAGTNSHDRRIGASAVVRSLLERGALGLVTTHDLALTVLGDEERMRNVHFSDHFEGESLVFDYKLREGVVQHSNALALMRLIGLPVESQPSAETAAQTTDPAGDKTLS